jgi:hypothetical protein
MTDKFKLEFAASESWRGGHYELEIAPRNRSSADICDLLSAIWSCPILDGPYLQNDCDPSEQVRHRPCATEFDARLYGLANIPSKGAIPCGTYAIAAEAEDRLPPFHWAALFLPLCSLSQAFDVGAYPFETTTNIPAWRAEVDEFLCSVARSVFEKVPFDFGIVGFEIDGSITQEGILSHGMPSERPDGILWNQGGKLHWHSPNRP